MNRLKKSICAGFVLLAIGEFMGARIPHDGAATARAIFHDIHFGLTRTVAGAARQH